MDYKIQFLTKMQHTRAIQSPWGFACLVSDLVARWDLLATSFKAVPLPA